MKDLKEEKLELLINHAALSNEVESALHAAIEKGYSTENLMHQYKLVNLAVLDSLATPTLESFSLQDDLLEIKLHQLFQVIDFIYADNLQKEDEEGSGFNEEDFQEESDRVTEFFKALMLAGEKAKELEAQGDLHKDEFPTFNEGYEYEDSDDAEEGPDKEFESKMNVMYSVDENGIHELSDEEAEAVLKANLTEAQTDEDEDFITLLKSFKKQAEQKHEKTSRTENDLMDKIAALGSLFETKIVPDTKSRIEDFITEKILKNVIDKASLTDDTKRDKSIVPGFPEEGTFEIPGLGTLKIVKLNK